ncbi:lipopolysaccharide biosynthesis protein [Bacillus pretiosus]|uniref:lipopolysaccharide biosynthesis protein n=1 Tax=Bacillus pretiosus TaxID=2983392 RepID=UPI003D65FE8A
MSVYKNTLWSLFSIVGVQVINIFTNIILARILAPEYFGILGMAMVFAGIAFVIQEAGLSSYLIYTKNQSNKVVYSTFLMNILLSAILVVIIWIMSPNIAEFYKSDQVESVLKYVCVGIGLGALGSTSRALLMKEQNFKKITIIDVVAEVISSLFALIFAFYIDGILAVATKYVLRPTIQSILALIYKPISLKSIFSVDFNESRKIISYSLNVLGSQLFMYANNNIDYFLVGAYLGKFQLGLYTLAFQWGSIARYYLSSAIMRVMFPEASKWQNDLAKVKGIYLDVISKLALITLPLCIGLALVSYEFIYILYGTAWLGVVPVLQILLVAGGIASITVVGGPVLRGIGKPKVEMKISILSFVSFTLLLVIFIRFGLIAVAYAELLRVFIVESTRVFLLKKYLNIGIRELVFKILPFLRALGVMVLTIIVFDYCDVVPNIYINFIFKILLGILTYVSTLYIFNKKEIEFLFRKIKSKGVKNEKNTNC